MADEATPEFYQFHVWIRHISPMIWRPLLMRVDSTLANLYDAIQIAFGWSDVHLHRFRIHGRDHGVNWVGGLSLSRDARSFPAADFQFRPNEWLLQEYDLSDGWQHMVRVERGLSLEPRRSTLTVSAAAGSHSFAPRDGDQRRDSEWGHDA
jgi:hypothetical protein